MNSLLEFMCGDYFNTLCLAFKNRPKNFLTYSELSVLKNMVPTICGAVMAHHTPIF
jgi:hypothetical protein